MPPTSSSSRNGRLRQCIARADTLVDLGVFPGVAQLDVRGWLSNFDDSEIEYAACLLDAFCYYAEPLVDALFRAAVAGFSARVSAQSPSLADAKQRWRSFLAEVVVTYVEGETPNVTDSGRLFARKARQIIGIAQEQIVEPARALSILQSDPRTPVLFVDDFVGSGNQMVTTWTREYQLTGGGRGTFIDLVADGARVMYAPLVAAQSGIDAIASECPRLRLGACHIVDERFSLTNPNCIYFPAELSPDAARVIHGASVRAGIVGSSEIPWDGHDNLALSLAFSHSTPDATIPLYYWKQNGWKPLVNRG